MGDRHADEEQSIVRQDHLEPHAGFSHRERDTHAKSTEAHKCESNNGGYRRTWTKPPKGQEEEFGASGATARTPPPSRTEQLRSLAIAATVASSTSKLSTVDTTAQYAGNTTTTYDASTYPTVVHHDSTERPVEVRQGQQRQDLQVRQGQEQEIGTARPRVGQ